MFKAVLFVRSLSAEVTRNSAHMSQQTVNVWEDVGINRHQKHTVLAVCDFSLGGSTEPPEPPLDPPQKLN